MSFQLSVDIAATAERVFACLTEPELVKRWQIDLAEPPSMPAGGLRLGAKQRALVEEHGKRFEVETEIVAYTPNQLLGYKMQSPNATVCSEYRLITQPPSTRIESTFAFQPHGWMRIMWPMVSGLFRRKIQSRLNLLKQTAESGNPPAGEANLR